MKIGITKLIPENIAPKGAVSVKLYNSNGTEVLDIPLGRLEQPNKKKLYSFGLVSDIHLWEYDTASYANSNSKFDQALSYFEDKENEGHKCDFCIVCGDLTVTGFYLRTNENVAGTEVLNEKQFLAYKTICESHTIPVYELMGNHESYYNMPVTDNLDKMSTYTGNSVLSYTIEQGNDLYIFLGQPSGNVVMSDDDYDWFKNLLANNQDKRCFVFVHSYIEEDSGDAKDLRENSIFDDAYWGATNRNKFMNLLKKYPNVILFHGHSHMKFEHQELDKNANYTEINGFKSVHIPSLAKPRDIDVVASKTPEDYTASQGYIVDVYDDCIVLNGIDFINDSPVALGVYKINT